MVFFLSSKTVPQYLLDVGLCTREELSLVQIKMSEPGKNFNLLITLPGKRNLLVKQERRQSNGQTASELFNEWQFFTLLKQSHELSFSISLSVSEAVFFDKINSIVIYNYLIDYLDLEKFYLQKRIFPLAVAEWLGTIVAALHRSTLNCQKVQDFIAHVPGERSKSKLDNLAKLPRRIEPEILGLIPTDCLKFFALYQRYYSLEAAVEDLKNNWYPCCLTHNDLKLNNILIHTEWEQLLSQGKSLTEGSIRLIDWERCAWGDPAFDLGTLIASYLGIWLSSFTTDSALEIVESLRLAVTPLEVLQPSIVALTKAYLSSFPAILEHRPDFLKRVVQFAGLALINQIWAMIQYQKTFGNVGICMLQVAKSLLCRPEQSLLSIFGLTQSELTCLNNSPT